MGRRVLLVAAAAAAFTGAVMPSAFAQTSVSTAGNSGQCVLGYSISYSAAVEHPLGDRISSLAQSAQLVDRINEVKSTTC
jgi:hypothetical protein